MTIKNDIKATITKSGKTMSEVIDLINAKYGRKDSVQNLSNKLTRESLKYVEALEIADVLEYDIIWVKK
jgi:DNA-directed RNA polymerase specialized sigma subunit